MLRTSENEIQNSIPASATDGGDITPIHLRDVDWNRDQFLNAIFPDHHGDVSVYVSGEWAEYPTSDIPADATHTSPVVGGRSSFVIGVMEDQDRDGWSGRKVAPTAALYRDGTMILVWAFPKPVPVAELPALTQALGMTDVDEQIPLPGYDGWELVHCDPIALTTRETLEANYVSEPESALGEKYFDADVKREYNEADYQQEMVVTIGRKSDSTKWKPMRTTIANFVKMLCKHEVGPKDGNSFILADMVPGQRHKTSIKAPYAGGLDLDNGISSEAVDRALAKLGCLAVRYSTHSFGKTRTNIKKDTLVKFDPDAEFSTEFIQRFLREKEKWDPAIVESAAFTGMDHVREGIVAVVEHAPMPKHRIVIPFAVPFEIGKEGATQKAAMAKWTKLLEALAALLGMPIDKSGTDPGRLFYAPRHDKGKPFEISLFGGPLFDWRTLVLDDPFEELMNELGKSKSKSVTQDGLALGKWAYERARGFQLADVIRDFASDKIRGSASSGYNVECPFDENHSNAGDPDDRACYVVNAAQGGNEWFIASCRHESCRDKTCLDMLGKMIREGWFGEWA